MFVAILLERLLQYLYHFPEKLIYSLKLTDINAFLVNNVFVDLVFSHNLIARAKHDSRQEMWLLCTQYVRINLHAPSWKYVSLAVQHDTETSCFYCYYKDHVLHVDYQMWYNLYCPLGSRLFVKENVLINAVAGCSCWIHIRSTDAYDYSRMNL